MDTITTITKFLIKNVKAEIKQAKANYGSTTINCCFILSGCTYYLLHSYLSWLNYIVAEILLLVLSLLIGWLLMLYLDRIIERFGSEIRLRDEQEISEMWLSIQKHLAAPEAMNMSPRTLVFIWVPNREDRTGHASLLLLDEINTYVSHYPAQPLRSGDLQKKLPTPAYNKALLTEAKQPDIIITIPNELLPPDELLKIRNWSENRERAIIDEEEDFKLKFKNCSDTVEKALTAGGFKLGNPIFRIITFGMTLPKLLELNILYTIALKYSPSSIQFFHTAYTLIVFVMSVPITDVIFQLIVLILAMYFFYIAVRS